MMMQLSLISEFGLILMLIGVLLPIYTANLFKMRKATQKQYLDKIEQGDKGWLIDYKLSLWISRYWFSVIVLGFILLILGLYI